MLNVRNKWCLITGASRGIGKLIALQMAKYGANLILHSRDLNHTAELENEIKAMGVDCFSVECDLNDLDSVEGMLKTIDESGRQVDIYSTMQACRLLTERIITQHLLRIIL